MNVGDVHKTNYWGDVEVVSLAGCRVTFKFLNTGNVKTARIASLLIGSVKDAEAALVGVKITGKIPKSLGPVEVGRKFKSALYGEMEVVEFRNSKNVLVKFTDSGTLVQVSRHSLDTGQVCDTVQRSAQTAEKEAKRLLDEKTASAPYWESRALLLQKNKERDAAESAAKVVEKAAKAVAKEDQLEVERAEHIGQKYEDKMGSEFTVVRLIRSGQWEIVYSSTKNTYAVGSASLLSRQGIYDFHKQDFDLLKKTYDTQVSAEWYEANRDECIAKAGAHQRNNREQTRERNRRAVLRRVHAEGSHTAQEKSAMLLAQGNKCNCCGYDLSKGKHIDHILPLSLGGSNFIENLQYLCQICNNIKGAKHPDEWAVYSKSDEFKARLAGRADRQGVVFG